VEQGSVEFSRTCARISSSWGSDKENISVISVVAAVETSPESFCDIAFGDIRKVAAAQK